MYRWLCASERHPELEGHVATPEERRFAVFLAEHDLAVYPMDELSLEEAVTHICHLLAKYDRRPR